MYAIYASVEQRDNPDLRGEPVAVGGSRERGEVAAASYEACKFGVRSAMASVTAKRQCPDLIFVKPRFEVYKAVSQQIREIFAEHTPVIEPLSLDEAYLDVTENLQNITFRSRATLRSRSVQDQGSDRPQRLRRHLLPTTSFWRSSPSTTANRTDNTSSHQRWDRRSSKLSPSGNSTAIGPATSAKMNSLGLYTGLDMRNQSLEFIQANFGKSASERCKPGPCPHSVPKPNFGDNKESPT
jgi:DNA polymerase-4